MSELFLTKSEKKVLRCLCKKDMNRENIMSKCKLSVDEITTIEGKFVNIFKPSLIKKFSILGINEEEKKSKSGGSISPYTLTSEGRIILELIKPFYKKMNFWIMIGTLFTALFTGILAKKDIYEFIKTIFE